MSSALDRLTSGMRTEVDHLRVQMRREMKELANEVDHRRDLLRGERDLFVSSQKLASSRGWLLQMNNGKHCCGTCTTHLAVFRHRTQKESPWLLCNGGVKYNSRF